jgi:hypothetical protein
MFIVDTQCTNVAAGRIIQTGGPRAEDPCFKIYSYESQDIHGFCVLCSIVLSLAIPSL